MPGRSGRLSGWATGSAPVSGGELAYHRTGGGGRPLVLSHGLTDSGLCWSRFAAAVCDDFDVLMLDARGHGRSSRPAPGGTFDPARDLAEAIGALGLRNPIVMGHSVGARATAAYANACPDQIAQVILEDPAFVPLVHPERSAARRAAFQRQVAEFQAMSERQIATMGRTAHPSWDELDFPAWAAAKRLVDPGALPTYGTPWQQEIDRITAPTLLVHGEAGRGSLITPALAEEIRAINPRIHTVEIRGAGHNVRRENFVDFVRVVRAFLQDCDAQRLSS